MASNCRLPEVGTHASQPGNHRLRVTIAKNFRFLKVGTDGPKGYHGKELPVPRP